MSLNRWLSFFGLLWSFYLPAAPLKVVTSTSDLAWAVREIGGDLVQVRSFLKGHENPHFVDAVPEFIRLAADAKVACVIGLELEIGWIPKVLARSSNSAVQPGGSGYCEVGKAVEVLDKPTGAVNRSMGDVHPAGNPHFWLSPQYFSQTLPMLTEALVTADPTHAAAYRAGQKRTSDLLSQLTKKGIAKIHPLLAGKTEPVLMEYHQEFAYFMHTFGLKSFGCVEEKPGVSPSAGRLAEIAVAAKAAGVKFVLAGDTAPRKTLEKFTDLSGIPVVIVPLSVQSEGKLKTYPEWIEFLTDAVAKQLRLSAGS